MKILGVIAAVVLGLAALFMLRYPSARVHLRMTVEVETPEGLKSGSSVSQLGFALEPAIGTTGLAVGMGQGEAVIVDLGARGTLYALLCGRDRQGLPGGGETRASIFMTLFHIPNYSGPGDRAFIAAIKRASGKADVPSKLLPFMVRFKDERDPKSVEAVDPANLAASFGEGVKLKRVSIETVSAGLFPFNMFGITGEPVATGIEKRLEWLDSLHGNYLHGGITSREAPLGLSAGDFAVGAN